MLQLILKRLVMMPLLILGIITATFVLAQFTKGNPLVSIIGSRQLNNPEAVAAAKQRWGLDRSVPERYVIYVKNLLTGDLGTSFRTKQPVLDDLTSRLPATIELVCFAMFIGTSLGLFLALISAQFPRSWMDYLARLIAVLGSCVPVFWFGILAVFVFSIKLGILPGPGRLDIRSLAPPTVTGFLTIDTLLAGRLDLFREALSHLVLPSFVLALSITGIVARMIRANMMEALAMDYVKLARSKGASDLRILFNHGLRNAMIPTLTILGFTFAYLITGSVLVETIFSWPGIGSYAVDASRGLDYPAITGVTIVGGLGFLLANLVTDVAYAAADPRIRLG